MQLNYFCMMYYVMNIVLSFASDINLRKKYNKLKETASNKYSKGKYNEFLSNINEIDYPRTNDTFRNIHKEHWEEYYKCLLKSYALIGQDKTIHPIALIVLEGRSITLKCEICISPLEMHIADSIHWYFNGSTNDTLNKILEPEDNMLISPIDSTLKIYNTQLIQSGWYWCKLGDTVSTTYSLTVSSDSEATNIVHPNTARNGPYAMPQKIISEYNLKVYTSWTHWSPCSKCDAVGRKNRYGYCTISLLKNADHKHIVDENTWLTETTDNITANEHKPATSMNRFKTVLRVFKNKLPCKSIFTPEKILDIPEIKNRSIEVMIKYCKKPCPKNVIFEVRDKQGNVLESANNSAGIYSMIQGMPVPSPPIVRTVVYQKLNKKGKLICPGNLHTDTPIEWKMGNQILNPTLVEVQSSKRIYIDEQMHLIFEKFRFRDGNIYSCWQNGHVAGIIQLKISDEVSLEMNHHIVIIGGILIVTVFLIVFWRVFHGQNRYVMR